MSSDDNRIREKCSCLAKVKARILSEACPDRNPDDATFNRWNQKIPKSLLEKHFQRSLPGGKGRNLSALCRKRCNHFAEMCERPIGRLFDAHDWPDALVKKRKPLDFHGPHDCQKWSETSYRCFAKAWGQWDGDELAASVVTANAIRLCSMINAVR